MPDCEDVLPPNLGETYTEHQSIGVVSSGARLLDIWMPLTGRIININLEIVSNPGLINSDPCAAGRVAEIKPLDPPKPQNLMTGAEYREYLLTDPRVP
ncbi:hypothetical protein [Embleya sp. AB8]|uniref:hypothetical protein n=1 Tax=Embleya sp. AB8 TaxID=3156304 RepID=UPI003C76D674